MVDVQNLIAQLNGFLDADEQRSRNEAMLAILDQFAEPAPLRDESEYSYAASVKSMLSGLACYTFDTRHDADARVWELEARWGAVMAKYNERFVVRKRAHKLIARYLLWRYRLVGVDPRAAFVLARDYGLLRRYRAGGEGAERVCVVGLQRKVGDNLFTLGRNRRHHRRYARTIGRQGFATHAQLPWAGDEALDFVRTLPQLEPHFEVTGLGDGKHRARFSAFDADATREVQELLAAVPPARLTPHLDRPTRPTPSPRAPAPVQLGLLEG